MRAGKLQTSQLRLPKKPDTLSFAVNIRKQITYGVAEGLKD
jgi:hypothetical protein